MKNALDRGRLLRTCVYIYVLYICTYVYRHPFLQYFNWKINVIHLSRYHVRVALSLTVSYCVGHCSVLFHTIHVVSEIKWTYILFDTKNHEKIERAISALIARAAKQYY